MKQLCLFLILIGFQPLFAQNLPDSCKLEIGTNLGGISDYGTELPFVDLMHSCRTWYSKDIGNPNPPFNSEQADFLTYRSDGYPSTIPQNSPNSMFPQKLSTIWAVTDGWPSGQYTVLYEGTGELSFWGGLSGLTQVNPNKMVFDFDNPVGSVLEMTLESSDINDPIRNIRVLMPGSELTYISEPFNPIWLEKLLIFRSVRFMDWFGTNSWGQKTPWEWDTPDLFAWSDRQQIVHYTWANEKGIPYEMAIKLMNDYDLDGWICVPHRADNEFITKMAELFHDNLDPDIKLTVEYSNEIWNWIFGQAQWCLKYGQLKNGFPWPECTVNYIQNCLDIWTQEYGNDLNRLTRVAAIQTAWQDVSNRVVFNLKLGSFDALSPTYYFGIGSEGDAALDALGSDAKVSDVAFYARKDMNSNGKSWLLSQKAEIADVLKIPMVFYEGGQHLTPEPFGIEPSYAQALIDIQRDTSMYNLYNEWFDFLRTLQVGNTPLKLMNFSFVSKRSAQYGSWGILETMQQDITQVPAPKYQSTIENMGNCNVITALNKESDEFKLLIFPNPTCDYIFIKNDLIHDAKIELYSLSGHLIDTENTINGTSFQMNISNLPSGIYQLLIHTKNGKTLHYQVVRK